MMTGRFDMKDSVQRFIDRRENRILGRKRRKDELEGEKLSHFNNEHPRTMQKGHEGEFTAKNKAEGLSREDKERDSKYRKAIERNDIQEAQRLVDEAAQKAGYNLSAYHGTKSDFTQFQMGREGIHMGTEEQARQATKRHSIQYVDKKWHDIKKQIGDMDADKRSQVVKRAWMANPFTTDRDDFRNVDLDDPKAVIRFTERMLRKGGQNPKDATIQFVEYPETRLMNLYAKINNPLVFYRDIGDWNPMYIAKGIYNEAQSQQEEGGAEESDISEISLPEEDQNALKEIADRHVIGDMAWDKLKKVLEHNGYDGIQYLNEHEGDLEDSGNYSYIALSPNDVKSADPIVKDEDGRVIMPSERFNISSPDTRGHGNVSNERKAKRVGNREKRKRARKRQYL